MNLTVKELESKVSILSHILPPIKYCYTTEGELSLVTRMGEEYVTEGNTSEESILLYSFLYTRGVLLAYIMNILKSGSEEWAVSAESLVKAPIIQGFPWNEASEGYTFWEKTQEEYKEYKNESIRNQ